MKSSKSQGTERGTHVRSRKVEWVQAQRAALLPHQCFPLLLPFSVASFPSVLCKNEHFVEAEQS